MSYDVANVNPANPQSTSEVPLSTQQPYPLPIAEFWYRIAADVIDLICLAVIFFFLSLFFRSFLFSIGPSGRVFSFLIAVGYFTIPTHYNNGQTVGKGFLKLTVTDAHGKTLTFKKSLLRSVILCLILALNGWNLSVFFTSGLGTILVGWIFIGGTLALLYGYLFNRVTRQGPHDLIAGSYVIHEIYMPDAYSQYRAPQRFKSNEVIPVCLAIFGALVALFGNSLNPLSDLYGTLNKDLPEDVFRVEVTRTNDTLTILVWTKDKCESERCNEILSPILWNTLQAYEDIDELEMIEIAIINRIDFGFGLTVDIQPLFYKEVWGGSSSPEEWLGSFRVNVNPQ